MENIKQLLLDQANKNDDIKQISERAAKELSASHSLSPVQVKSKVTRRRAVKALCGPHLLLPTPRCPEGCTEVLRF